MFTAPDPIEFPELVIAISGPIGVNVELISREIEFSLTSLNYKSKTIRLTTEMQRFGSNLPAINQSNSYEEFISKMEYATKIRENYGRADTLSRIAIQSIREIRREMNGDVNKPIASFAYIIRQLKLPEEVTLLRKTYGRQFILISAYGTESQRIDILSDTINKKIATDTSRVDIEHLARKLIERDSNEDKTLGQNLIETFHLADVFIDGINAKIMKSTLKRFFEAFFGKNDISPSKDEFGMYAAKSASLRSADLSRQVGASIFSYDGDIISQGCNEVPKFGGGNYWDEEQPDFRDINKGYDPNDRHKLDVVRNIVERLFDNDFFSSKALELGNSSQIFDRLVDKNDKKYGVLADANVMNLTEYGRVVHAEMNAVCDAARNGRSIKNTVLYCTTLPCHNCTKHIIAAGITKVVFLEPYLKSKAEELHGDEIEINQDSSPTKISFVPFLGISPHRYRDIFQKGKRKKDGKAEVWNSHRPKPMIDIDFPSYAKTTELWAVIPLLGSITEK